MTKMLEFLTWFCDVMERAVCFWSFSSYVEDRDKAELEARKKAESKCAKQL